ncbi:hypothetical protein CS369_11955 [Candidatus Symbiopectobacterium sp. 'North America']|nr:hypothetical protein [Candidatus Symbiopectobacterium sp. 'North America']
MISFELLLMHVVLLYLYQLYHYLGSEKYRDKVEVISDLHGLNIRLVISCGTAFLPIALGKEVPSVKHR